MDENLFFREATLRICSSLNIEVALKRCLEYLKAYIPVDTMSLYLYDAERNLMRFVAAAGGVLKESERVSSLSLPVKGRNQILAHWKATSYNDEVVINIVNEPDEREELPELLERLGLNSKFSIMNMGLKLEGNRIGSLALLADGLHQYTDDHEALLRLLHDPFAIAMSKALEHKEMIRLKDMLADDNRYLFEEMRSASGSQIIGSDLGLKPVMKMIQQVSPLRSHVLLLGETGVGKEVIANAIHYASPRRDGPFIKVNCGAIPDALLDSELFGHEKGAFTGAISQKRGRFERANKGTIFLDEVGELPAQAQVRLLRVIQTKEIERVGGTTSIPVDIRIISATHRNLEAMVAAGQFREDLWFRLNVFPIMIPPLRRRKEDIPALVHHFIERKCIELKLPVKPMLAPDTMDMLMAYDWPGNVRELENLVERALIQGRGGVLSFGALLSPQIPVNSEITGDARRHGTLLSLDEMTAQHIRTALQMTKGKINGQGGAAQILRINPNTLRTRMNKLGIPYGRRSWEAGKGSNLE